MIKKAYILFFSLAVLGFASCSEDDPSEPAHEHFEASGLVLIKSGERFFRIFQGQVVSETKSLMVPLGDMTDHYSIRFLDDEGNEFDPPTDPDKSLDWEITDPTLAEIHRHDGEEWEFHIEGLKAGSTEIELMVKHVDHYGFRTPKIQLIVQ